MIDKTLRFTYNNETDLFCLVQGEYPRTTIVKEQLTYNDICNRELFEQNSSQVRFVKGIFGNDLNSLGQTMNQRLELIEKQNNY